ncbi:hypothetical protein QUA00_05710 [Microcoleus sp. T2B6]|uniref:hypothetical protein n=1 Tax=Microcoleus sp. T2B6 TaxID=3055424 RepID=UPI002FD72DC7
MLKAIPIQGLNQLAASPLRKEAIAFMFVLHPWKVRARIFLPSSLMRSIQQSKILPQILHYCIRREYFLTLRVSGVKGTVEQKAVGREEIETWAIAIINSLLRTQHQVVYPT